MKLDRAEADAAREDFLRMEGGIQDVQSWADTLTNLGACPNMMEPGTASVIGRALSDIAGRLLDQWDAVHRGRKPN